MTDADWQQRVAAVWAALPDVEQTDDAAARFRARIEALAAEPPPGHPAGLFERACAFDSTGRPGEAVPLYRAALAAGLSGTPRRRATIQLASSLRTLGRSAESVELLTAERGAGSDELDDAVCAFLALALTDVGREREAVSLAVGALAGHLPRYRRAAGAYARLLVEHGPAS